MTVTVVRGNALNLPLPGGTVDLVVTSPPYFGLRSYQDDGAHYPGQLGSEPTPAEFVDALLAATAEMVRVLKSSGSIWVNLGDKYSGAQAQNDKRDRSRVDSAAFWRRSDPKRIGIPNKSLCGIPWRYALRCIDDLGLILRAEVIWSKPNGLPESVTDRVRRSHEQWFHFTKEPRYFSAVDSIREPLSVGPGPRYGNGSVVSRPTFHAPLRSAALGPEIPATIHTDDGPANGRGWCDLGQPEVTVDLPMTDVAYRLKVVEPVGFQIRVEAPERDLVVDLKMVDPSSPVPLAADDALMSVAVQRGLSLLDPVGAAIAVATAAPSGAVLACPRSAPCPVTLGGAEAARLECALDSGNGFAARITLAGTHGGAALYVWRTLWPTHTPNLPQSNTPLGKLPGSVWTIPTQPLTVPAHLGVDHFAAFPMEWPRRIIAGWSPAGVCVGCGDGRRPVVARPGGSWHDHNSDGQGHNQDGASRKRRYLERIANGQVAALEGGYACNCLDTTAPTTPALVLDPFGGTGTVALVAHVLGRHGITVDLSADYCRLAAWRTTDPGQRAAAAQVEKPAVQIDGQGDLLAGLL